MKQSLEHGGGSFNRRVMRVQHIGADGMQPRRLVVRVAECDQGSPSSARKHRHRQPVSPAVHKTIHEATGSGWPAL